MGFGVFDLVGVCIIALQIFSFCVFFFFFPQPEFEYKGGIVVCMASERKRQLILFLIACGSQLYK